LLDTLGVEGRADRVEVDPGPVEVEGSGARALSRCKIWGRRVQDCSSADNLVSTMHATVRSSGMVMEVEAVTSWTGVGAVVGTPGWANRCCIMVLKEGKVMLSISIAGELEGVAESGDATHHSS